MAFLPGLSDNANINIPQTEVPEFVAIIFMFQYLMKMIETRLEISFTALFIAFIHRASSCAMYSFAKLYLLFICYIYCPCVLYLSYCRGVSIQENPNSLLHNFKTIQRTIHTNEQYSQIPETFVYLSDQRGSNFMHCANHEKQCVIAGDTFAK